jgi:hypothetical protein
MCGNVKDIFVILFFEGADGVCGWKVRSMDNLGGWGDVEKRSAKNGDRTIVCVKGGKAVSCASDPRYGLDHIDTQRA